MPRSRRKSRRACERGAAGDVGKYLLHDGVVAVLSLGLDQLERRVGEHRVVTPDREQFVLSVRGLLVQVADAADDQPRGDGLAFLRRERRVFGLGDLGVGDPGIQLVVPDRARVADRRPGVFGDGGDRGADAAVHRDGDREPCAAAADRADHRGVVERRVQPDDDLPGDDEFGDAVAWLEVATATGFVPLPPPRESRTAPPAMSKR
jgi:hypothetical protein